jgi:hypothetical protein
VHGEHGARYQTCCVYQNLMLAHGCLLDQLLTDEVAKMCGEGLSRM